jgi:hypothetical protein
MTDTVNENEQALNYKALHRHSQNFFKRANDIYIDTTAIVSFLSAALDPKKDDVWNKRASLNIKVPSQGNTASIRRNSKQLRDIMTVARDTGQWEKSLVFLISITEDLLGSYIRLILRSKPILLLNSIKGNEGKINVSLADVIKLGMENIIEDQVNSRVTNAIYASPREYSNYLGNLMDFKIDPEILASYVEIKARRDIIIHSNGIANQIYLDKSGDLAPGIAVGDKISANKSYFENSLRATKRIVKHLNDQMLAKYGGDEDIKNTIAIRGI